MYDWGKIHFALPLATVSCFLLYKLPNTAPLDVIQLLSFLQPIRRKCIWNNVYIWKKRRAEAVRFSIVWEQIIILNGWYAVMSKSTEIKNETQVPLTTATIWTNNFVPRNPSAVSAECASQTLQTLQCIQGYANSYF